MLSVSQLSYQYQEEKTLQDVSFSLQTEDFCAILGPNGAGKTTLINLISGILPKQSGKIEILNRDCSDYSVRELAQKISVVPQRFEPVFHFSVFDMVMFGRNPYQNRWDTFSKFDEDCVMDALNKTHLLHLKERKTNQLSGGEWQRVLIARAIAQQAPLMLLDEPLANLDISHKFEILDILTSLNREQKSTILLIMHDISLTVQHIPKTILLKDGKMSFFGETSQIITEKLLFPLFDLDESFEIDKMGNVARG